MKYLNTISALVIISLTLSGCYTQLKVAEPYERPQYQDRAEGVEDPQEAYDLGYDDGWHAGLYYRDYRRSAWSTHFGYMYSPGYYYAPPPRFSFGFSYGWGSFYDPFFYDPFYHPYYRHYAFYHRPPWRHRYYGFGNTFIAYNYYYYDSQPRAVRTPRSGGVQPVTRSAVATRSTVTRSGTGSTAQPATRQGVTRNTTPPRSGSSTVTRGSSGSGSSGSTVVRSRGGSGSQGTTVRPRGNSGSSGSGSTTPARRGSSDSSGGSSATPTRSGSGSSSTPQRRSNNEAQLNSANTGSSSAVPARTSTVRNTVVRRPATTGQVNAPARPNVNRSTAGETPSHSPGRSATPSRVSTPNRTNTPSRSSTVNSNRSSSSSQQVNRSNSGSNRSGTIQRSTRSRSNE